MVVAILAGATGTGKSSLAMRLALANGFEIISADSRQLYRGLAAGTNAPGAGDRARVPHHLVACLDPAEAFSPREFPGRVHALLEARPDAGFLIVGGTGLYLKELLYPAPLDRGPTPEAVREEVRDRLEREGLAALHAELLRRDPEGAQGLHPNDRYRIVKRWENLVLTGQSYARFTGPPRLDPRLAGVPMLWLDLDREKLYARIDARVGEMAASGWLEEVRGLMREPGWRDFPAFSSLGYRSMAEVAAGEKRLEAALAEIRKQTRNYAKRQLTFFRNQFPLARHWDAEALQAALERCGWNWAEFRRNFPDPG